MRTTVLLACSLTALAAAPASAQVRLPKVPRPAAAGAAGLPAPAASSGPTTGAVRFDDEVLEITPAVVDRLVQGLAAEQAVGTRVEGQDLEAIEKENEAARKAHERARRDWEPRYKEWKRCVEGVGREAEAAMGPAPGEQDQARARAVAERIQAAHARGDVAEVKRLADSLTAANMPTAQRAMAASSAATSGAQAKCGEEPKEPPYPPMKQPLDYRDVREAGMKAGGFTDTQYGILRERVVPFVVGQRSFGRMVYTDREVETLKAKLPDLKPYEDTLKRY